MAKTSMTTLTLAINDQQAKRVLESLKAQMESVKKTLEETQEKFRGERAWDAGDTAEKINKQIKELKKELKSLNSAYSQGMTQMNGIDEKLKNLSDASYNQLTKDRTTLTNTLKGLKKDTKENLQIYEETAKRLQDVRDEIAKRENDVRGSITEMKAQQVLAKPQDFSTKEIDNAIAAMEKLRDAKKADSDEWNHWNVYVQNGKKFLEEFSSKVKETAMKDQMGGGGILTMSDKALADQKKYWQEIIKSTDTANPKLAEYKDNLEEVLKEEQARAKLAAETLYKKVNDQSNPWQGTIGQTKEAYEQLKKYRELFDKDMEMDAVKEIDQAMDSLKQKTKEAEQGFLSYEEVMQKAGDLDNFDGTIEDLELLRKRLLEIKNTEINLGGEKSEQNIRNIDEALTAVDRKLDNAKDGFIDIDKISKNLKSTSLKDLKRAAAQLEKELENCAENMDDYAKKAAKLRQINGQIDQMNKNMKHHASVIAATAKRLASYVLVYSGFNEVVGWIREMIQANLALSDSMADVQKTTGLTEKELKRLSDSIRNMDTRTTTEELHQLAATAGQIGLTATDDILGFVKAANMINVALNELGSDGVASLMKVATATGEVNQLGVEKALLSIGSSINELSANSAASAPAITDMVKRLGAISASARISSADLAAIGATTDALAQSTEVAGTALSMFIGTLVSKTGQVAKAVGIDEKYLKGLVNQGKTTEAMIAVFERMKDLDEKSGLAALTPLMGDLGSEGQRMTNTLTLMATRVDFLKQQIELSRSAFRDATSIINEYNIKNENAIAILERMKNAIKDYFTSADFVGWIKGILEQLYLLPRAIEENKTTIVAAIIVVLTHLQLLKAELLGIGGTAVMRGLVGLKNELLGIGRAFTSLLSVVGKHPFLAIASGVALFGAKLYDAYKKSDQYGNAQERLNKLGKKWRSELSEELKTSRFLFAQLENSKKGTEEYNAAKKAIIDNYGAYLKGMGKEVEALENIEAAQEAVTRAINRTVYARIAQEGIAEAEAAYAQTTGDAYERMYEQLTKKGRYTEEQAMLIVDRFRTFLELGKELPKDLKDIAERYYDITPDASTIMGNYKTTATQPIVQAISEIKIAGKILEEEKTKIEARYGKLKATLNEPLPDPNKSGGNEPGKMTEDEYKQWVREQKRLAKEANQAAMSALESYYNEREAFIRKQGMEQGQTEVDINRQLESLNTEKLRDEIELRKMLLDQFYKSSTFDPKKYKGVLTGVDYFSDKDLNKLREQLKLWGVAMEDGLMQQLTEREVKLEEQAYKIKQRIQKILLEDDFNEQVRKQYMDTIDELGLLFNLSSNKDLERTKQVGETRLAYLQEWSKESYNLTAKDLQDKMEQEEIFSAWRQGRTAEDYEALLIQLRKFNDDMIEADKKTAERRKKIADAKFYMSGQKTEGEERIQKAEAKLDFGKQMESFGVGGEQVVNDLEIEVLKEKIVYEQQWLALLAQESQLKQKQLQNEIEAKERLLANESVMSEREKLNNELISLRQRLASEQNQYTLASTEAINNMLDYQKQATGIYTQQLTWYFDHLKDYQGQIDTFAQSMGEGIFGSKEDRQQAAKDLLSSVLTTSKNLLQVWLTQLATRRLIDDMEVKQTEATEMRKRAIKLQSMIQDGTIAITGLTVDAAKAEASTLLSSAEATGKEVAKKGLIGLAIGAAISAALSALLGAALGKVNQAKAEIASTTGASSGRLATGMLTYADGNYPVLGNDGNVYNAKYEGANMKTGIYRGGAHFGIFSEKKPEAIIDGDTTQRLIMNHPDIWKAIVTLSKTGRLEHGMRTFASGNIDHLAKQVEGLEASPATTGNADMIQMQATMAATQQALAQLTQVLAGGIKANINMYGEDGMYKNIKKAEKFASVRKYK